MSVIAIFGVKCRSEYRRTIGFYIIFSDSVVFYATSLTNSNIISVVPHHSLPNNAETDSVGHLGPRTFRSTWGVPKLPAVKFSSRLFLFMFFPPKFARHHRFFNHFPLFTSILNVIQRKTKLSDI